MSFNATKSKCIVLLRPPQQYLASSLSISFKIISRKMETVSYYLHLGHIISSSEGSLPSARQHPSYGDCLEVKREYYQNCSVLDCVTQCSQ